MNVQSDQLWRSELSSSRTRFSACDPTVAISPDPSDHPGPRISHLAGRILNEVVKQRMDALITATEARHAWLKQIGIQPPLGFVWIVMRCQELTERHLDYLKGMSAGHTAARPCQASALLEPGTRMSCVGLLYRSLLYCWTNCGLVLWLSDEQSMSAETRSILQTHCDEIKCMMTELEQYLDSSGVHSHILTMPHYL